MPQLPDLTYQVVAYTEVPDFNTNICVDWAFEMIAAGYDTPSLLILAGLNKPTNYFQTIEYLNAALKELRLEVKTGDEGVVSYSSYFIKQMAKGEKVKENLKKVYKYCQSHDYESSIYDFYLLYWAWDDLDYGNEYQCYWEGANKDNIEAIVVKTAKDWLIVNEKYFVQNVSL